MDKVQKSPENEQNGISEKELMDRRGFLRGLGKWSLAVIGGALLGEALVGAEREANAAGAWANRVGGGGAWANRAGGGGAVVAPGGAWANAVGGGGAWANRGGAWANRGTAWINRF
jgi:hypothetical protein